MQNHLRRNIVITGSNKGIGYATVEKLLGGEIPYDIITTSRNTKLGEEALKTLKTKYPTSVSTITYHQLDVNDDKSVDDFVEWLKNTSGKLDILLNNAAIGTPHTNDEQKHNTIKTNFFSVVKLTEKIIPLLSEDGKVIMVSSSVGILSWQGPKLKKALEDENITEQQLFDLGKNVLEVIKDYPTEVFLPEGSYPASKALLNAYVRRFLPKKLKTNQQCYALCPGLCATDMGSGFRENAKAKKEIKDSVGEALSAEEGADTPVYLINLPFEKKEELNAKFFAKREIISY